MFVTERIHQSVYKLPEALQVEVLDFAEYLLSKVERETIWQKDEPDWSNLSLSFAMHGMEDEAADYTAADLKVVFS